ncbi:hypothetical protein TPHV1_180016 [Treponema phagedenis]|uniref:Uncharacterized protein n=1 Tax=Treponema phagedenis TaxID=162 RepID=A0A0B7GWJ5_TREPH|nr:hypothetical protein TPHV1_180016 [Treponema phagedenis]
MSFKASIIERFRHGATVSKLTIGRTFETSTFGSPTSFAC